MAEHGWFYVFHILMCAVGISVEGNECGGLSTCSSLGGVLDGSRCFFLPDVKVTWQNAWAECTSRGGQFAQVHTESEYVKIRAMVQSQFTISVQILIGMQRDNAVVGSPCSVTNDTTWWYDGLSTRNTAMAAGNTWIRYLGCAYDGGGEYCMALMYTRGAGSFIANDVRCSSFLGYPLCQFIATEESFNVDNYCLTETPIETISATQAQDCADACWQTSWCRSFNYIRGPDDANVQSCQLFTWSTLDTCPKCPRYSISSATETCVHYNYVP